MSDVIVSGLYPQDTDAEAALLGAMLWDMQGVYDQHGSRLKMELWHHPLNQALASAMVDMHVAAVEVNVVTVTNWLREIGELERLGGPGRVAEVLGAQRVASAGLVKHYLEILEGMAARRMLLRQAQALQEAACNYTVHWREALQDAESALFDLHSRTSHQGMVHVSTLLPSVLQGIQETIQRRGHVTNGLATGITSFDRITMGLKAGLHILAARPSKGKTTVLLQKALNVALGLGDYPEFNQEPQAVGIFSLETDSASLTRRGLLNLATLSLLRLRDGQMSRAEQEKLKSETLRLQRSKLYIESCFALSIQDFRAKARMLVKRHDLKMLMVDYLQLMTSASKRAQQSRNIEVAEISLGLKQAALELNIPIVVLAQLNREGDVARPKLSHLRECGQIEQDADTVSMICDAPEWASQNDPEDAPWSYLGLDIVKQKDGPTTSDSDPLILRFDREFFRLTSVDEKLFSNNRAQHQAHGPREKQAFDREKRPRGRPRKDGGPTLSDVLPDD